MVYYWETIKKQLYCFLNIAVTKAGIFMKFYVVVNYYFVGISLNFHEDPCINGSVGVVNAHTRNNRSLTNQ